MKKLLLVIAVITGLQASAGNWINIQPGLPSPASINLVSSTIDNSVVHFSFKGYYLNPVATAVENSVIVSLEGATPILRKGAPDLPKLTTSLIIPNLAEMEAHIISSQYTDYQNIVIAPSKGNLTRDIDPATVPFTYGEAYAANANFPGKLAATNEPYIMRDFRGQTLIVYPFQYNPVTKTLRVYYDLTVELKKISNHGINPLTTGSPVHKAVKEFSDIYAHQFLNYSPSKYTPTEEEGSMLIISYGPFLQAMQPFVNWKISKGIPVDIVDVASIGNSGAIKSYLQNYYQEHGMAFVLLVGDNQQVPTFMSANGASDNAYTYVAGVDHYNDFLIGRFSAENVQDVTTQVNKVLYYEINPSTTSNWFASCIGIGSDQGPGDDNEYDYQHIRGLQSLCGSYTYSSLYELFDGSQGGLDAAGNPSPSQVGEDINQGASVILYCGHGSQTSWGTSGFSNSNVNNLTNTGMLPFIWSVACVNGDFTNGTCFAEAWLRAHNGENLTGAVATMMSTINQSWNPPMEGEDEMVNILVESYSNNIKRTFGGLSVNGLSKMIDTYAAGGESMADTWVLFGDPSIVVRTAMPQIITATHDPTTFIGMNQFQLSCPVDGALACITMNNVILGTALVSNGIATINYPGPLSAIDTLKLVITKYNYIPYITTVPIIAASGPYVAYQTFYINDPAGNNNHLADVGENITLDVTLKNLGVDTASGVNATISTSDPYVTITDNNQAFGDILANEANTQNNAYAASIANYVPDQHHAPVNIAITATSGETWNSSFSININAPAFTIANVTIDDATGNANNSLDPGETVNILIPTTNSGHADALNTEGTLSSACPYITINNGGYSFNTLTVGSVVNAVFNITIHSNTPIGTNVDLDYSVVSGSYSAQKTFYKVVGIVDENFESGDLTHFSWQSTGSNLPWIVTTENPYEGLYCSKSGAIADNQQSIMAVTMNVLVDDSISFYRKVSSEATYDFLAFFIDDTKKEEWSGELAWGRVVYPVTAGTHTFKWRYQKDYMATGGSDAAWVDFVVFPPVDLATGIQPAPFVSSGSFNIYPNPATQNFQVDYNLNQTSPVKISLSDATGRLVRIIEQKENTFPGDHTLQVGTDDLNPGLYFINMQTNEGCYTHKLILGR